MLHINEVLGGVDRVTFQMTNVLLPHEKMLEAIERLGTQTMPLLRDKLARQTNVSPTS